MQAPKSLSILVNSGLIIVLPESSIRNVDAVDLENCSNVLHKDVQKTLCPNPRNQNVCDCCLRRNSDMLFGVVNVEFSLLGNSLKDSNG